ncbi:hypothetical protein C5615_36580 [Burkholderia cepacia]|uniref:EscI/YscI/HrpB family type III secretion system inner rod protein n=2 Tax=Burkholderia cepacia TaxID=292 RepID=A0A2S8I0F0_BURCE|nr:hypothetical protein C5615_36580 [Burkholderia cepacia]HDR9511851.1 hypothetical protein [Burkholderia cepacia]
MESITAIEGLKEVGAPYAWMVQPRAFDSPVTLSKAVDSARTLDPVAGIRRAEAAFDRDNAELMSGITRITGEGISIASLYQLQVRATLYKVKHEIAAGIVSNLSQSVKTVLNAS